MRKQPLEKLISVLIELKDCQGYGFGHIMYGIMEYLRKCECCAFCKNYGKHDPCDPNDRERDFEPCNCGWFNDRRNDEQYKLPDGTVWDFYRKVLEEER